MSVPGECQPISELLVVFVAFFVFFNCLVVLVCNPIFGVKLVRFRKFGSVQAPSEFACVVRLCVGTVY